MNDTNLTDILDIKPPMEMETGGNSVVVPIVILVVLFLIGAALLFWAYHKPKPTHPPGKPDTDAHRKRCRMSEWESDSELKVISQITKEIVHYR